MHRLLTLATSLLITGTGCRHVDCNRVYEQSFWEDAAGVKARMDSFRHIPGVRIDENHGEDKGPNKYSVLHFKGTVLKSWKGEWRVGEPISFVHHVDYRASTTTSNQSAGKVFFVFTNQRTEGDIGLEAGDFGYSANVEQVLQCFFRK